MMTGIPTAASLRKAHRRLANRSADAASVLSSMQRGAILQLQYQNGRQLWRLSTGAFITAEVAKIVAASGDVVGDDDSLSPDAPPQTWRYVR
jgi:hypothetical protein